MMTRNTFPALLLWALRGRPVVPPQPAPVVLESPGFARLLYLAVTDGRMSEEFLQGSDSMVSTATERERIQPSRPMAVAPIASELRHFQIPGQRVEPATEGIRRARRIPAIAAFFAVLLVVAVVGPLRVREHGSDVGARPSTGAVSPSSAPRVQPATGEIDVSADRLVDFDQKTPAVVAFSPQDDISSTVDLRVGSDNIYPLNGAQNWIKQSATCAAERAARRLSGEIRLMARLAGRPGRTVAVCLFTSGGHYYLLRISSRSADSGASPYHIAYTSDTLPTSISNGVRVSMHVTSYIFLTTRPVGVALENPHDNVHADLQFESGSIQSRGSTDFAPVPGNGTCRQAASWTRDAITFGRGSTVDYCIRLAALRPTKYFKLRVVVNDSDVATLIFSDA